MSSQKKNAVQLHRTPAQKAALTRANKQQLDKANAVRLAQIVNLHLAGLSLTEIGAQIGATADEVDQLLATDAARYVRSQPALRVYVRNFISERYLKLLDAVWADATDMNSSGKINVGGFDLKLASQDRAIKILDRMAKLHGAEAPVQHEVEVTAAPEAVENMVKILSQAQGLAYDMSVFDGDVIDAEIVHDAAASVFPETDVEAGDQSAL